MGFWSDLIRWWNTKTTNLLLPKPANGGLGQTAVLNGTLARAIYMTPIANANVNIIITPPTGAATTTVKVTDATGKFSVSVPLAMVGNYVVKADYAGVANQYKPVSASTTINVLAAAVPTTLTITPSATTGTVGDTITISIVLQA